MDKFRFKFSAIVWVLLVAIVLFSIGGIIWNIFNLIEYIYNGTIKIVSYSFIILINVILFVFSLSILICSQYKIKGDKLIINFGFISVKIKLENIVAFTHFKKSDTLVCYYDNKYTVIVISPSLYDDFVIKIREKRPAIVYNSKIDGEDTPN